MSDELPIFTVSELTRQVKSVLEETFPLVAVRAELSNVRPARSGHVYLTLKDEESQLSGVMWRTMANRLRFDPVDGLDVVAVGRIEVYVPRGSYQLIIEELLPQGLGPLELAFRQLCDRLRAEGLFDPERKRPLPRFPRKIAIITSPTGAAVRDMLQVLTRRWPVADLIILPVAVQGENASPEIAKALADVGRLDDVELVIVGRGGGSLEDLWAFNTEPVARAIVACRHPVISAVGHEIDVTVSDLVADLRALTPSEAAERATPDLSELRLGLRGAGETMIGTLQDRIANERRHVTELARRRVFTHPGDRLRQASQTVDELSERTGRAMTGVLDRQRQRLAGIAGALEALSPLATLARGYSLTRNADGRVIRSIDEVSPGERLDTMLSDGTVTTTVEATAAKR